ncbi:MAG TPA: hypothetical protein VEL31_22885 [Ktedonobacteraceae bacterium]|nr:hypothetical protein [Ktedonobacteraceae bacterium]
MPVPIICLDEDVRYFAERFREVFSKPQYQHFVTVLLGLMLCEGTRTLSGLLRQIADSPSLAGLSRFLSEAPWEEAAARAPEATEASRSPQSTRRDRVSDRG